MAADEDVKAQVAMLRAGRDHWRETGDVEFEQRANKEITRAAKKALDAKKGQS